VYFFVNWEAGAARRIDRMVMSDLPKIGKRKWEAFLMDEHNNHWGDAVVAIVITILACYLSIEYGNFSVSLVAGIIIAGIAADEWMPPQVCLGI